MAIKTGSNIDLNKNQILQARLENLSTDPGSPGIGQIYFNTVSGKKRTYNGVYWDEDLNTTFGKQIMVQRCQFLNTY